MPTPRRLTLLALALAVGVALGVPSALGQSVYDKKNQLDTRISGLRDEIERAKQQEGALSSEIGDASSRIEALESRIGDVSAQLAVLERELATHRAKLDRLRARFVEQTKRLTLLRAQHEVAQTRLEERLVALYQTADTTELDVLLQAESLTDLIEQFDYFSDIGRHDKAISDELERLKIEMRAARLETGRTKREVEQATAILADKAAEQRAAEAALVAQQSALEAARGSRQSLLASVKDERHEAEEDLAAMEAASASLAAQIRSAQGSAGSGSTGSGTPSAAGFVWPTSGVLTSGFGWRWGRVHEGIDVAAACGTAVRAAAAGSVIYAGWLGGYGNLLVVDHGNGLATAYAHLSSIAAGGGSVGQGQYIGAMGTTGSSTGCHLHFEVRVNGSAVDPMGYL